MQSIKKQFIKNALRPQVIENKPGSLTIRIARLMKVKEDMKQYESYIIQAAMLLEGIEKIDTDYETGKITILYDENRLTAKVVWQWILTIIDVGVDYSDWIINNWDNNKEKVMNELETLLKEKIPK